MSETQISIIRCKNSIWLKREDVVKYFLNSVDEEETDVRIRFEKAAEHLSKVGEHLL